LRCSLQFLPDVLDPNRNHLVGRGCRRQPPGFQGSYVTSVSEDGAFIGGYCYGGQSGQDSEGVLWPGHSSWPGLFSVSQALRGAKLLPKGWLLGSVNDVMNLDSGEIALVGDGTNPQGNTEGWYARFTPRLRSMPLMHLRNAPLGPRPAS